MMKTSDFFYELPEALIAQSPAEPRDHSRLMVLHAGTGCPEHRRFDHLTEYLRAGDALVINDTKVFPARLTGVKEGTDRPAEALLLRRLNATDWEALVKPGRSLKPGAVLLLGGGRLRAEVRGIIAETGGRLLRFTCDGILEQALAECGQMPLPPYIREKPADPQAYQTVYAKHEGSAAAPTAGLHFTPALLDRIRGMGVHIVPVLLHVGLGTFRPVRVRDISAHRMHAEYYEVTREAAERVNRLRDQGGRVICVGTTSLRTLETVADETGHVSPGCGETRLFITPGVRIKSADALITNFHLPESTLLMLVSAFAGRETILNAYREAVLERYRFFSFGDAMLILSGGKP
jgi:S-adenosylmethionine:tRNA ribosyltransferase-isomerase